ncbi:MAG: hypothetical protein KUG77_19155 [Nannocystaceae bacterium]|nr:hypothetical protein [Nannocystaceae bacterium]
MPILFRHRLRGFYAQVFRVGTGETSDWNMWCSRGRVLWYTDAKFVGTDAAQLLSVFRRLLPLALLNLGGLLAPEVASAAHGEPLRIPDGEWVSFDDSQWGGASEVLEFRRQDCRPASSSTQDRDVSASERSFSGCAGLLAHADDVAGMARELDADGDAVDLSAYLSFGAWVRSDAELEICLHTEGLYEPTARCVTHPLQSDGAWVQWEMPSLDPSVFGRVSLVTFVTREGGAFELEVADLMFSTEVAVSVTGAPHDAALAVGCRMSGRPCAAWFWLCCLLAFVSRKGVRA